MRVVPAVDGTPRAFRKARCAAAAEVVGVVVHVGQRATALSLSDLAFLGRGRLEAWSDCEPVAARHGPFNACNKQHDPRPSLTPRSVGPSRRVDGNHLQLVERRLVAASDTATEWSASSPPVRCRHLAWQSGASVLMAQKVAVMYAGKLVETGAISRVFNTPAHPYTQALKQAMPSLTEQRDSLMAIPGTPPDLSKPIAGCAFAARCPQAMNVCARQQPADYLTAPEQHAKCWLWDPARTKAS